MAGFWRRNPEYVPNSRLNRRLSGDCLPAPPALQWRMPRDPFVREKFTRLRITAKKVAAEYFERFPKERFQTEVESWRHLQSDNIEFTMKRLREPIDAGG
jgi:hypothetical protein